MSGRRSVDGKKSLAGGLVPKLTSQDSCRRLGQGDETPFGVGAEQGTRPDVETNGQRGSQTGCGGACGLFPISELGDLQDTESGIPLQFSHLQLTARDSPGAPVVKALLANAGDTGPIRGPGRSHMPLGS